MSYCTQQQLIDRFGEQELIQLTDRDNQGVIDSAVLNRAIGDADAEINGYLTNYPLPLITVPANLVRIACDITRYYLHGNAIIDPVKARYGNAIKYLEQVAKGVISLGPDINGVVAATSSGDIELSSSETVFSRDVLSDY